MKAVIREIQVSDALHMIHLKKALAEETLFMLRDVTEVSSDVEDEQRQIKRAIEDPLLHIFVADHQDEILGFIVIQKSSWSRNQHVAGFVIGVKQSAWGTGVSHQLMDQLLETCKSHHIKRIELDVVENNQRAISLYQKYGFQIEGTKVMDHCIGPDQYLNSYLMARIL